MFKNFWQFKSGTVAPIEPLSDTYWRVNSMANRGEASRAWDRSLGGWVYYYAR